MQLYDITIAANTTRQLDAPGSYFYYYAGSAGGADSTITLRGLSSGLRLILKPGQAFRLPKGQTENAWVLTNYAGAATIIGTVLVGDGEVTDNRITGSVEIIDGGKARTLALQSFLAYASCGGVAANMAHVQLWNPIGSGKNAIVKQAIVNSTVANSIYLTSYNTQLTTNNGFATNKKIGAADSVSIIGSQNNPTALQTKLFYAFDISANQVVSMIFNEPIILPPGTGLTVRGSALASSVVANIDFYEESAT